MADRPAFTHFSGNAGLALQHGPRDGPPAVIDLRSPNAPACYSPVDIDRMADGVAMGLLSRGLGAGAHVGILSDNRAEVLAVILGAMRAGAVAIPINRHLPPDSLARVIEHSEPVILFCEQKPSSPGLVGVPAVLFGAPGPEGFAAFLAEGLPVAPTEPGDTAMILYTSGSTAAPKGVVLNHAALLWVINCRVAAVAPESERYLVAAPLYHLNGFGVCQVALASRNTVVLMPRFNPKDFIKAMADHRCTSATGVPAMFSMLLCEEKALAEADLGSLRSVRMGSAPAPASLIGAIRRRFPNVDVTLRYATTEVSPLVFFPPSASESCPNAAGVPLSGVEVRIVDAEGRHSREGALEVRSPGLMDGYYKEDDLNAEAFTPDRFYRTGDLFRQDDQGGYHFLGRADDMFKVVGEKVFPREVETVLETCPGVQEAAVVPVEHDMLGYVVGAFLVRRSGEVAREDQVLGFARKRLRSHQVPYYLWFVKALPLTGLNKLDRKALVDTARRNRPAD